jgi:hypothetical protein
MKFFICDDEYKFKKTRPTGHFGKWHYSFDNEVECYIGDDFVVLYCGYLIEGDIEETARDFSFHEANGNFFAVKLTSNNYEISVDYFNNHKVFVAEKYGIEITNHLQYMTIQQEDWALKQISYDLNQREISPIECRTFFGHIESFLPVYNYVQDCKDALEQEVWDVEELTEYIHQCMSQHAQVIKDKYKKRFISLSEGIDSAVQSQYFKDDPQYLYDIHPCDAGPDGLEYMKLAAEQFADTNHSTYNSDKFEDYTLNHLNDSSTRWCTILPTMMQVEKANPDIVMYGVNGDEMFARDLIPHLHMLSLKYYSESNWYIRNKLISDIENKKHQYGATYTLGTTKVTDDYVEEFIKTWLTEHRDHVIMEYDMLKLLTPKFYTRAISCNNDVLTASLYNDRRIFHEVFKTKTKFLEDNAMDSPIQRKLLEKFDHKFTTPHKDALYADYDGIFSTIFHATVPLCMEQNI